MCWQKGLSFTLPISKKVVSGKGYRKTAYYTLIETQQRPTFATPHIKRNGRTMRYAVFFSQN